MRAVNPVMQHNITQQVKVRKFIGIRHVIVKEALIYLNVVNRIMNKHFHKIKTITKNIGV